MIFHVRRWTHSCVSSTVYDLGTYASLKEAIDRACAEAGIKANDPQYKQKAEAKRELVKTLTKLKDIEEVLGHSPELDVLMQSCQTQMTAIRI